jgi:hypothetical protein
VPDLRQKSSRIMVNVGAPGWFPLRRGHFYTTNKAPD